MTRPAKLVRRNSHEATCDLGLAVAIDAIRGSEGRKEDFDDQFHPLTDRMHQRWQSVANAMVVQRALDSAEQAAALALDPVPGAGPVPLWRPRGSAGLFDGLPGQRISSSASFAA